MSIFISILIFIAILTALIFIHEMGHLLTAKHNKVTVEEFGMGLPPRIWGFKKGGILWSINWIPLGGFCKIAGEIDPDVPDGLTSKSVKARIAVLSAGSIAMILFPLILLPFAYMLPLPRVSEDPGIIVSAVINGSPAEQAGIQADDILVSIDGKDINYFTDAVSEIQNASDSNPGQPVTLLIAYENGSIRGNFSAVPLDNPSGGLEALGLISGVRIAAVTNDSPAYNASLQVDDIIISVDGIIVNNYSDLNSKITNATETKPNESVTLLVARNTSEGIVTLALTPVPRVNPPKGAGKLGIQLSNYVIVKNKAYAPWDAIPKGVAQYGSLFVGIKDSFGILFSGEVAPQDALSGPIGIASLTNEVSNYGGPAALFMLAALLSIMLGLINLFPFPGLDGGRIFFVVIEGLRRGKRIVSVKTEERIHSVGFYLLLVLFVVISVNDIQRVVSGRGFIIK
jgi:regulator of sigma E protease